MRNFNGEKETDDTISNVFYKQKNKKNKKKDIGNETVLINKKEYLCKICNKKFKKILFR